MLASLDRLEALQWGGARVFFGHDPEYWRTVPQDRPPSHDANARGPVRPRDMILVAFGPSQWQRTIAAFADRLWFGVSLVMMSLSLREWIRQQAKRERTPRLVFLWPRR